MNAGNRVFLLSVILIILGATHACRRSDSDTMHTPSMPVRSPIKQNWVEMTRDDFLAKVIVASKETVVSDNSAVVKKLNQWVESFDEYFRRIDPSGMMNIPKPNLLVLNSNEVNAFVASASVCYDLSVSVGKATPGISVKEVSGVIFSKKDQLIQIANPENCLPGDIDDLTPIFEEYERSRPDCKVDVDESKKEIRFDSKCRVITTDLAEKGKIYFKSKKLVLRKIPNWFVVLSGIFAAMQDESSLVGVVAHELAHYYRSHGLSNPGEYDYFYTQPLARNHDRKPVADEGLRAFGETVFRASTIFDYTSRFPEADLASPSAFHFLAIGDLAKQAELSGFTSVACKELRDFETVPEKIKALQFLPFGKPADPELLSKFFRISRECLRDIDGSQARVDLQAAYTHPQFMPYLSTPNLAERKKASYLRGVAAIGFLAIDFKPSSSTLVGKVFDDMEGRYRKLEGEMKGLLQKAFESRLGQYTTEQEADDISAELLMSFGLGSEAAVKTYLNLLPAESGFGGMDIGKERCLQIFENDWIDPIGEFKIAHLPLGNYSENHHSTCYRAFNIQRELKTHRYLQVTSKVASGGKWDKMVAELSEQVKSLAVFEMSKLNGLLLESCPISSLR